MKQFALLLCLTVLCIGNTFAAAIINTQPTNVSKCDTVGGNKVAAFTIVASGATSYQWQYNNGAVWTNVPGGTPYSGGSTATLTINPVSGAMNGYKYRCIAYGAGNDTSLSATLTVNTKITFTSSPPDTTFVFEGGNTLLPFTASGTNITYQWFYSIGSGSIILNDGGYYSGTKTPALTLTNVHDTLPWGQAYPKGTYRYYALRATNGCYAPANGAYSLIKALVILKGANITQHPRDTTVCMNGTASFRVSALGTGLSYQWQVNDGTPWKNVVNGATYSNAKGNPLTINVASVNMYGYQYRCIVTNSSGKDTSNFATLAVNVPPFITKQPTSPVYVCSGSPAFTSLKASPTGMTYQWQSSSTGSSFVNVVNNTVYSGVNKDTLRFLTTTTSMPPFYRCIVYNQGCSVVISSLTVLAISPSVFPAIQILTTVNPVCPDSTTTFMAAPTGGGATPAYQWQVNSVNAGTNSATFKPASIKGGDKVKCVLTSSENCATPQKVNSNTITMIQSPCDPPAFISAGSITTTSVVASWASSDCAATYQVRYRPVGTTTWKTVTMNAGTLSKTITGLLSGTQYEMQARTRCNAAATVFSGWTPLQNFTTLVNCVKPTSITVTTIKKDRVTLGWGTVSGAYSYQIHYRVQGTTTWTTKIVLAPITTRVITGLTANTTYEYQLITICDASGKPKSAWTTISTFKTLLREGDLMNDAPALTVYPNPATDKLTVTSEQLAEGATITITDVTGRVLITQSMAHRTLSTTIDVKELPSGLYLLYLRTGNTVAVKKWVKG